MEKPTGAFSSTLILLAGIAIGWALANIVIFSSLKADVHIAKNAQIKLCRSKYYTLLLARSVPTGVEFKLHGVSTSTMEKALIDAMKSVDGDNWVYRSFTSNDFTTPCSLLGKTYGDPIE